MPSLIIGVAGGSGSGKTTIARRIAAGLAPARVAVVDMDAYYRDRADLSHEARRQLNWDHPDAIDLELFIHQLDALGRGEIVDKPVYDFATHLRKPNRERVGPADIVIVDGILLFTDPRVRDRCAMKVFIDTDADERLIRRLQRDVAERGRPLDEIIDQYLTTVRPMHLQFVEPSKRFADVIVPRGGENDVAIGMIISLAHQRLRVLIGATV
ncbi:MAG: uridine kinase [Gemmatimonadota bacterium]|nr:uridine kinase [Gemmatimonadota bacterium]